MATTSSSSSARPEQRRRRVLHVLPETRDGGAENQARYLLGGLRDSGEVDVELVCFDRGARHAEFAALDIPIHEVARRGRLFLDLLPRALRLRRMLASSAPEILHTWLPEANLVGLLAARGRRSTRVVITQRGGVNELQYRGHMRLQRALLGGAAHAISNSRDGADVLIGLGMPARMISVVGNGVPPTSLADAASRDEARAAAGLPLDAPLLLLVSRVDDFHTAHQKGIDVLLAAAALARQQVPGLLLALAGPTGEELRAAGLEPPDWVVPLGWVPRAADVLRSADVVVVSSRAEGNSNVAAEALLLGLPVASTATGDHQSLVDRGGGRLAPPGDAPALAAAILELLASPPPWSAVRAAVEPALSAERMVAETLEVYRELLG